MKIKIIRKGKEKIRYINGCDGINLCNNINKTVEYIKKEKSDIDELNFGTYEFITHKNYWKKFER